MSTVKVAISDDFLKAYSRVEQKVQKQVREFMELFRSNPSSPGIHYETIKSVRDKNIRSARVTGNYRAIIHKSEEANVYLLLWIDKHDAAYDWAMRRSVLVNPDTGSIQVVEVVHATGVAEQPTKKNIQNGLFSHIKDKHLKRMGVPEILLPSIRAVNSEDELENLETYLPQEAGEALVMLAAGYQVEEVIKEIEERHQVPASVDINDFETALEVPDSGRRFWVVENELELAEMLNAPLKKWRVFLHPAQKRIVSLIANGPVRVSGGAGTGKTVVAMHRAKFLAENIFTGKNDRILFTTFTKNLAADIKQNLSAIVNPEIMKRIDIISIDSWVSQFLQKNGITYQTIFGEQKDKYWNDALNVKENTDLPDSFYKEEWEQVIQRKGIVTEADYLIVPRIGRGRKVDRETRKSVWKVFSEYRRLLSRDGKKELADCVRDARILIEEKKQHLPYRSIIVDEAQDMSDEVFRLLRSIRPEDPQQNDIFIAGDCHQRIYQHKVTLSHCGINVVGRSYRLKVNYRTTDEIQRWAAKIMGEREIDDLDGSKDTVKGYISLLHGDAPEIMHFLNINEECQAIVSFINQKISEGVPLSSIAIIARTDKILDQYSDLINFKDIKLIRIKRSVPDDSEVSGVRLATMHRVKGLEFDIVIVAGINNGICPLENVNQEFDTDSDRADYLLRERALFYVAITRAKKFALVTSYGENSEFLR